jgi:hypothetical protein
MLVDAYLAFQFIKKLVTPFEDMPAFKLGLIDKEGNFLRQRKYFSPEDKKALGYFDVLVINLKKLISKFPGGASKIATVAAALMLLRSDPLRKRVMESADDLDMPWLAEEHNKFISALSEDMAPVNVTAGIAGLTPDSLKIPEKARKKYKAANAAGVPGVLKRNVPDVGSTRAL